jgi:hypothetical protein
MRSRLPHERARHFALRVRWQHVLVGRCTELPAQWLGAGERFALARGAVDARLRL